MRILHIIPALLKGGAERVALDLANSAVRHGHDATVLVGANGPDDLLPIPLDPRVGLVAVYSRPSNRVDRYLGLAPWARKRRDWLARFDVIHCHLAWSGLLGLAIRRALSDLRQRERPLIVHTNHGVGMDNRKFQQMLLSRIYSSSDALSLMAIDPYWRRFIDQHPTLPSRIIPNGVSLPAKLPGPPERTAARDALGIPADALVAGTVGRMVAERQPLLYFPAFAEIDRLCGERAHLVLGGEGPEVETARALAQKLGFADRVHLPGLVRDPIALMAGFDVYLTMMVGKQAGIAALEAAAIKVPVLGIQMTTAPAAEARHWLMSHSDPMMVGQLASRWLMDEQARGEAAESQSQHVWSHLGAEHMARAYYQLYREAAVRTGKILLPIAGD